MTRHPKRTRRLAAFVLMTSVAALGALLEAGLASARAEEASATVTVSGSDFRFRFSPARVGPGKVIFVFRNVGRAAHDFKIAGKKTPVLRGGRSARLTVTLKRGRYPYLCTVTGHAALGMRGVLVVR